MTRRELLELAAVSSTARPAVAASGGTWVKPHTGAPTLFLGDRPAFSAAFWVHAPSVEKWESAESARRAAQAGVHTYAFDVGSGTEWRGPGPGRDGHFDFSTVERRFARVIDVDREARFHLRCHLEIGADDWWSKLYPGELEVHSNGRRYTQSFASSLWREQANAFLRAYIAYLGRTGLLERVIAFQVGAGHTGEWVKGETSMYDVCGDYSEPMRRAFGDWLRRRYGNDAALGANVPTAAEQLETRNGTFRDARREARTIDYFRCLADLSADAVIDFCRTVKQATGGSKLAGAFYGYLMELAWNGGFFAERADSVYTTYQRSGHLGLRRVLDAPEVDFLVSPYSYGFRGIGGDGPSMIPAESARLHGKLVLIEDDTRTHVGGDHNYGQAPDLPRSIAILRRNFAQAMTRGQGMWWASWQVDAARDPGFLPVLRDFERIGNLLVETDRTPASEVAVFVDDESLLYESCLENFDVPGIFQQRLRGLAHMGAPFDTYMLEDLVEGRVPPYRLYVFLNAFRVDAPRREKLARELRRDGRVALWIYAPGFAGEAGLDSMRELTGLRFGRGERPWGPLVHLTSFDHAITRTLPRDLSWGTNSKLAPPFYIDDPKATVLGEVVYSQGNCKPGFALRTFERWTSVYSAAPAVPSPVLRALARFAGAHLYQEDGDCVYASRALIGIHTAGGGPRTVRLRARVEEVVDVFERRTVARDADRFEVVLPPASTALYFTGAREFAARLKRV